MHDAAQTTMRPHHRAKLDEREEVFLIPGPQPPLRLFLRRLRNDGQFRGVVLYLHGATFPSALSVAYRFGGTSWRDALCQAGFDVWALDFYGFGGSDRYPDMDRTAESAPELGLASQALTQIEVAVSFIRKRGSYDSLSLISHSWGSMPGGLFASAHPTLVDRFVMFAPPTCRPGPRYVPRPHLPAWKLVTNEQQWARFVEDVPPGQPQVMIPEDFAAWADAYLDSDPQAREREPHAVKTPTGPLVEVLRAWHGELAWEPANIQCPVAIIRGSWDGLCTDADAGWLFNRMSRARQRRDIKIARGTHLMHLELMRTALWRESVTFLQGEVLATHRGERLMQDHGERTNLPGYNPGAPEVARSPISMQELSELEATTLLSPEDFVYLRLSHEVLKDQAEDLVGAWRGVSALLPHLRACFISPTTGEQDKNYGDRVGARFVQWVLDTSKAQFDQTWLDYQYEIGLRHHRTKKNQTDNGKGAPHIRGREVIAFSAGIVSTMRPYLEKGGYSADTVHRMHMAWMKAMILHATLWIQPYMNQGDF